MSKAEQRALEVYPDRTLFYSARECYKKGYEAAEKDLALTWEDVRKIVVLSEDVFEEGNNLSVQEFYEEVLKRFKEQRND